MTRTITYDETKYQLVPKEPTDKMIKAGAAEQDDYHSKMRHLTALRVYSAMKDAAPQHPAQEPISKDEATQNQVSGICLIREMKNAAAQTAQETKPKPMAIKEGVNWSINELAVQMQVCFTSYKLEDGSYGYFFDIEQCKKILNDIVAPTNPVAQETGEDEKTVREFFDRNRKTASLLEGLGKELNGAGPIERAETAFNNIVNDRNEWKQQHENLLFVRQQDLRAAHPTDDAVRDAARLSLLVEMARIKSTRRWQGEDYPELHGEVRLGLEATTHLREILSIVEEVQKLIKSKPVSNLKG